MAMLAVLLSPHAANRGPAFSPVKSSHALQGDHHICPLEGSSTDPLDVFVRNQKTTAKMVHAGLRMPDGSTSTFMGAVQTGINQGFKVGIPHSVAIMIWPHPSMCCTPMQLIFVLHRLRCLRTPSSSCNA